MLVVFITVLIFLGILLALAKGKGKVSKEWHPLADYLLVMTGVFVGATLAILLTDLSTRDTEREKTERLLLVAAQDLSRYDHDIQTFQIVYKAFKAKSTSGNYKLVDYLKRNPRRFPALPKMLITSEYALSHLHPDTIRQLTSTIANLQKMHEEVHDKDFLEDRLQLYMRLMDTETGIATGLIGLEMARQLGRITDDMLVVQQQALIEDRIKKDNVTRH